MPNRYMIASKLSEETFETIIGCYAREVSSGEAARLTGVSAKSIKSIYQVFTNCLFGFWFSEECDTYLQAVLKEYAKTGRSQIDDLKQCMFYCPAITDPVTCVRSACHVCPREQKGSSLPPAMWGGINSTMFRNRKFLAALSGYHLIARLHYFVVIDKTIELDRLRKRKPGERLDERLREYFSAHPVDLKLFDQCWSPQVNFYFFHERNLGPGVTARPRSSFSNKL